MKRDVFINNFLDQDAVFQLEDVALYYEDRSYAYSDIFEYADKIKEVILSLDASSRPIALRIERSPLYYAAILACLSLERPFIPIAKEYSEGYISNIFQDAYVGCVVKQIKGSDDFLVSLSPFYHDADGSGQSDIGDKHIFAIFYTSGSSGVPKGVRLSYRALKNRLKWMWRRFSYVSGEVQLFRSNVIFIDSVWESLGAFIKGVPTFIAHHELVLDPASLLQKCSELSVSRITVVPSYLKAILAEAELFPKLLKYIQTVKYWLVSGEVFEASLARKLLQYSPNATILNLYGSTEVMGDASCHIVTEGSLSQESISIGVAIDNTEIAILDGNHQPLFSPETCGVIAISGYCLANGYTKSLSAQQSRSQFIKANIFSNSRVWFLTGDLGKFINGELFYLGRSDRQVKIRGIKVSLDFVESTVKAIGSVSLVAAVKSKTDNIALFIVAYPSNSEADLKSIIKTKLANILPENLLPNQIIFRSDLPMTLSGKVNYMLLSAQVNDELRSMQENNPINPEIECVQEIVRKILGVDKIKLDDNLFNFGLNSLNAIHIVGKLRKAFNPNIKIRHIFDYPSIQGIVGCVNMSEEVEP